jgi:Flp pilus assembly protein TadG
MSTTSERGAAAVEFALLAPVLIMLFLGIAEFARAYNVQISLSSAAREGVRVMAIGNDANAARTAAKNATTALQPPLADTNISISPATCSIAGPFPMEGKGVMLCGG